MYVSDSTMSNLTCEPQPATGSTHSAISRPGISSSRTMLSPSEIASLRQEAKESMEVIGDYLKHLRAMKAQRH